MGLFSDSEHLKYVCPATADNLASFVYDMVFYLGVF